MAGHPDDQSYANWRGAPIFASASTPVSNAAPIIKSATITNFASLRIRASAAGPNGMTVNVQYFTDVSLATPLGGNTWNVPDTMSLDVIDPALGDFVQVTISTPNVAAFNIALAIIPMNVGNAAPVYPYPINDVSQASVSIAASSTSVFILPFVAAGRGHYEFRDINTSTKLAFFIDQVKQDGTAGIPLVPQQAPVTQVSGDFVIDATPLCVAVTNGDTVAHNAGFFLSVDGR